MTLNLDFCFRPSCCFPQDPKPVETQRQPTQLEQVRKIAHWVTRADQEIPRFNALNHNGLYSLLDKEITDVSALLEEFNEISAGIHARTPDFMRSFFERIVIPKKQNLENTLAAARQKINGHEADIASDSKIAKKWLDLRFPESALEKHADCARFVIESGLGFSIAAFQDLSPDPDLHGLRLDTDGHPLIKVEGQWRRWELIKQELVFDPSSNQIRSKDCPSTIVEGWTYLSPDGLKKIDRMNHETLVPICQISEEEYQRTLQFANRFYETNHEVDAGIPKDCILQFMTTQRRRVCAMMDVGDEAHFNNVIDQSPSHIVMRLITPDRQVYSFGFEVTPESLKFTDENMLGTVLAKVNKAGDYEEFRPFKERTVTCLPLTSQRAQAIINYVNEMGDVRFQFLRQNCSSLARMVMMKAGYEPFNNRMPLSDVITGSLPSLKDLPIIGPVANLVESVASPIFKCIGSIIPECAKSLASFVFSIVTYIPNKILTVMINLATYQLGNAKMLYPLEEGVEEDEFYDNREIIHFSKAHRSLGDFFSDENTIVYHSKLITDWQKQQRSTFSDTYEGRPKLVLIPRQEDVVRSTSEQNEHVLLSTLINDDHSINHLNFFDTLSKNIVHFINDPNDAPEYGYQDNAVTGIGFWLMQGARFAISLWEQSSKEPSYFKSLVEKTIAVAITLITAPLTLLGAAMKKVGSLFPYKVDNLTIAEITPTSPEKVDQIYGLLENFNTVMRENHINYSMDGGTLLGAIRHKGVIPWDDDADAFILSDDVERFESLQEQFRQRGIIVQNAGMGAFKLTFDEQTLQNTYGTTAVHAVNLDLFVMKRDPDGIYRYKSNFFRNQFPSEYFLPDELDQLQDYPFGPPERGLVLQGPTNPRRYLETYYGPECFQYALQTHSHVQIGPFSFPLLNFSRTRYAIGDTPPFAQGNQWRSPAIS